MLFDDFLLAITSLGLLPSDSSLGLGFLRILLDSQLDDPFDQLVGNRLVQGKLEIPLGASIRGDQLFNRLIAGDGRIQPDVMFERGEVNQDSMQSKGRHPITNNLLGVSGRRFERWFESSGESPAHQAKTGQCSGRRRCSPQVRADRRLSGWPDLKSIPL
jgi:hypothetical protein